MFFSVNAKTCEEAPKLYKKGTKKPGPKKPTGKKQGPTKKGK